LILGFGISGLYRAGALKEAMGHLVCEEEGMWENTEVERRMLF